MVEADSSRKPQVGARLPRDVHEEFVEYCEEREISKADGVRRAIRHQLAEEPADRAGAVVARNSATVLSVIQTGLLVTILLLVGGFV